MCKLPKYTPADLEILLVFPQRRAIMGTVSGGCAPPDRMIPDGYLRKECLRMFTVIALSFAAYFAAMVAMTVHGLHKG